MNHASHPWIIAVILGLMALSPATAHAGMTPEEVKAFEGFKALAERGDAHAQLSLGLCFDNGSGVTKDQVQAVSWYRKAAEKGYAKAQDRLGTRYRYGLGVAEDQVLAVSWYRKAADQGDARAQDRLANHYRHGEGVAKDEIEAYAYLSLAGVTYELARGRLAVLEKQMSGDQIAAGKKRTKELQQEIDAKIAAKAAGK